MKKLLLIISSAVFLSLTILGFTYSDDPLDSLLARLEKLTTENPQEKVHLHFDKPYYSLGEDMWFKAYVVNAERNFLSTQSKILYVDLMDDRDSVRKTLLLPLVNGMASGDMHLSDSILTAGKYHIYAYTKWMINFGSDYFFKKDIPIVNALRGSVTGSMQYRASSASAGRQLTTDITYSNDSSRPFAGQPVSYVIKAKGKTIADGKAQTNSDGKISIQALVKDDYKTAGIVITTTIKSLNNQTISQDFVIRPLAAVADVQFFPEGGKLVNNIRTKIGFKALKPNGLGESVTGYVADENNEHVAEFKSEHAGMGIFALQPLTGKTYTAVITHEDGSERRYALPKADADGYVLNINHIGKDSLSVRVAASPALINGKEAIIIAQCNGIVQFVAKTKLDKASNVSYISARKIPTGIIQFTLFSPDYVPVAERLIFIDHNDQLSAEIKPNKETYTKRSQVKMDITVTDAYNEPVIGSFSVAVTDQTKVNLAEDNENTILSNLLLTSDIKGYIEQPNYYFNPINTDRQKHLDQLLLTQGWRRFTWAGLQANKYPLIKYKPEQSLSVSGNVTTLGNKPVSKGKVTLFASTVSGPILIDTVADENGHFVFDDLNFSDSTKLVVRASNAKNRTTVKTTIDKKPRIPFSTPFDASDVISDMSLNDYLKFTQTRFEEMSKFGLFNNSIALKEVKIVGKKNYFADRIIPNSSNLSPGSADQVIKPDKLSTQTNLLNAFYGLPGIEIKSNKVYRIGRITSITRPQGVPMMVVLDGMTIEPDYLKDIPPSDVAGIELLTSGSNTAIYGDKGAWGVIIITTKRGTGFGSISNAFNVAHDIPQGYSLTRKFYSPAYDTPSGQTKMADLRSTIYWNPDIITDAQGKASITYFNADDTGTCKVTLEGLDTKGKLIRKTVTYGVK
jgi:hypothetical protein